MASALGRLGLCDGMSGGHLILGNYKKIIALFCIFSMRGYWLNSALHILFGVFLWTCRMFLQNSVWEDSIVVLSHS